VKVERVEFQTRVGGRILEHMSNGRTLPWGEVLEWDPPRRFVLAWHPNASDRPPTEVEVRIIADETDLVELEHRGWSAWVPTGQVMSNYAEGGSRRLDGSATTPTKRPELARSAARACG
jgi:hypothetical protein